MPQNEFFTDCIEETERIGANLAKQFLATPDLPPFIALYGDLGVGKTAFIRGFVGEINPAVPVRSPTFSLVYEYPTKSLPVFHFDMYRIDSEDDLDSIGFYDYLQRHGICLVEWSEKIPFALPDDYLRVEISKIGIEKPDQRKITVTEVREGVPRP